MASAQAAQVVLAAALEVGELGEGVLDVLPAAFQLGAPVPDLAEQVGELTRLARLLVVHVDDRADLLEREPEPLAAQDEVQPRPVPAVVDPRGAAALGRDQAQVLVVAHGPVGDAELLGHLGDRPGAPGQRCPTGVGAGSGGGGLGRGCHGAHRALRLRQRQAPSGDPRRPRRARPCSSSARTTRSSAPWCATLPRRRSPRTSPPGTGTTTSRQTSFPRWVASGCSAWSCPRSSAAPSPTSPPSASRLRSSAGSTSRWASPCRRASAWGSTRSSPTAPRIRRSSGCPTWSPGARSRRSA